MHVVVTYKNVNHFVFVNYFVVWTYIKVYIHDYKAIFGGLMK